LKSRSRPFGSVPRLNSTGIAGTLVLFVAGEPEMAPSVNDSGAGLLPRLAGSFLVGPAILAKSLRPGADEESPDRRAWEPPPPSDYRHWHLPPSQAACLDVVLEAARRARRPLLVVDVDRPGDQREMVERFVGSEDVLPLLVRPDGARLVGQEHFAPAVVRKFIALG